MRSDIVKKGATRCAHRSLFNAMGFGPEDLKKPLIGIVNSFNEVIPGHIHLREIAEAAKLGVAAAGGTPLEFPAIGVCDGIAMGHTGMKFSLASRELIADSIESVAMATGFDGLVLIPNCDKVVPGMLMAAARLNIPCVVVSGGPMLPGRLNGKDISVSQSFEAAGEFAAGKLTEAGMAEVEAVACPGCGSCAGLFTANTMNCLTEALGMGLPGNGTIPAAFTGARRLLAKQAGHIIMDLIEKDIKPRDILTMKAFENAITVDMGIGGSSNTVLHLTAIAHEAGIPLIVDNTFATPYLVRPIEYGADIVVHSATKFIGGHGTAIGGVIIDSGNFDWTKSDKYPWLTEPNVSYHGVSFAKDCAPAAFVTYIRAILLRDTGATISPVHSFVFLQGLETLSLRVERHVENALKVVEYLNNHPLVEKVNHPSVSKDKVQQELYAKYFPNGGGSIFTFEIKGDAKKAQGFIDQLELFSLLANVADVKSLAIHPASTTHSECNEAELLDQGIKPNTIRLSIGTENINDIIEDLHEAFKALS